MIEAQVLEKDQDPSLGHYLQEWLAHARGRVRATTYTGYEYLIRVHAVPALGEVPLSELSPLHFQRLSCDEGVGGSVLSTWALLGIWLIPAGQRVLGTPHRPTVSMKLGDSITPSTIRDRSCQQRGSLPPHPRSRS